MKLDDLKFKTEADRRKYLSDLERLKKIREEEKTKNNSTQDDYISQANKRLNKSNSEIDLDIPNFNRVQARKNTSTIIDDNEYEVFTSLSKNQKTSNKDDIINSRNKKNQKRQNITNTRKRKRNIKKNIIIFFQLLLLSLILFSLYIAFSIFNAKEKGFYTVAIFGVDSRDGNLKKGALADVNMLVSINRENGDINLLSIYRDSYTQIDEKGTFHKLNEAYFKGGPKQAISALERNLDIKIDDYATFNWKAVIQAINILGGVDIEITKPEFQYINGFITETVNATNIGSVQLKAPGMQHLDGVQAVAYARLRLMDTDFNRTQRQRKVVSLALEKAKQADFLTLNHILTTIFPQISTSISLNDILPFAKNINKYHLEKAAGFPFEKVTKVVNKRDYVVVVSLEDNVKKLHEFLYGENINYKPSSSLKKLSDEIIKNTKVSLDKNSEIKVKKDSNKGINKNTSKENKIKNELDNNKEKNTKETIIESKEENIINNNETILEENAIKDNKIVVPKEDNTEEKIKDNLELDKNNASSDDIKEKKSQNNSYKNSSKENISKDKINKDNTDEEIMNKEKINKGPDFDKKIKDDNVYSSSEKEVKNKNNNLENNKYSNSIEQGPGINN